MFKKSFVFSMLLMSLTSSANAGVLGWLNSRSSKGRVVNSQPPVIRHKDYNGWSYESVYTCSISYSNMRPTFSNATCSTTPKVSKNKIHGTFYSADISAKDHRPSALVAHIFGCKSEREYVLAYERAIAVLRDEEVCGN